MGGAFGSTTVVTKLLSCPALLGSGAEDLVERFQDLENNKAGKSRGKGIARGKTILLDEEIEGAV
jgi:hypothetical protein